MMKRQLLILLAILALFGQNTMGQPNSNKNTVALGVPILDDNGDFTGTYTIDTYTDVFDKMHGESTEKFDDLIRELNKRLDNK